MKARYFICRPRGAGGIVSRLRWNLDLMQIEKLVNGVYAKVNQSEDDYWTENILFGDPDIEEITVDVAGS